MEKSVARLVRAREAQEKVCIYADYDLDGTSACALLRRALEGLGFERIAHYQPSRLTEGYGLHEVALRKIAAAGATVVVTVDLGITAIHEANVARELGVDLIITDHHLPKESLPEAFAVVNPNRGNCPSGLGHLCGTGVAFYLALALRRSLLESGAVTDAFDPKSLLDCFAIGTLTDMVPLVDENRALVKHGLLQLAKTDRPGLRVLLQALKMWGQPLTSQDVAIRFAPKLNALSRMELGVQPLDLYLVEDEREAQRLVAEVLTSNQTRVSLQRQAEALALDKLEASPPRGCAVVIDRSFHRGVVGLVAARICQDYGIPAFVGAAEENGEVVGSVRAPDGVNVLVAMESAGDALVKFGGHAAAAGFETRAADEVRLRERLERFFEERASAEAAFAKTWAYDAECELEEIGDAFMAWYDHLAPFGQSFQPPIFRLRRAQVASVRELKGGHLRLTLAGSSTRDRAAIWFSPPSGRPSLKPGDAVEALVEPQWNWFNGRKSVQLLIQDLKLAPRD